MFDYLLLIRKVATNATEGDLLSDNKNNKAPWQSGYAADCKSVDLGSTPGGASISNCSDMATYFSKLVLAISRCLKHPH